MAPKDRPTATDLRLQLIGSKAASIRGTMEPTDLNHWHYPMEHLQTSQDKACSTYSADGISRQYQLFPGIKKAALAKYDYGDWTT
ncbi:hypothetical protein FRC03_011224 [Tulasnella sp. 419]|nr:hypothetical protein FRC03_011224 [Tulasnella sp. 419]